MSVNNINRTMVTNAAVAATFTTDPVNISQQTSVAIQASYSGTFVGAIQYEVSNDGIIWTPKGSSIAVSAAGSTMTEWADVGFCFVHAIYTKTSGTIALLITVGAKG